MQTLTKKEKVKQEIANKKKPVNATLQDKVHRKQVGLLLKTTD